MHTPSTNQRSNCHGTPLQLIVTKVKVHALRTVLWCLFHFVITSICTNRWSSYFTCFNLVIGWCTHCKENKRIPNEATPLIDIDSGTTTASALNPSALNPSVDVDTTTCRDYLLGETSFWSDLEKTVIYI